MRLSWRARWTTWYLAPKSRASAIVRVRVARREMRWTSEVSEVEREVDGGGEGVVGVIVVVIEGGARSGSREMRAEMLRRRGWLRPSFAPVSVAEAGREASARYDGGSAER